MKLEASYYVYKEITKLVNPYEYLLTKVPGSKYSVSKLKPSSDLFYDLLELYSSLNILETFMRTSYSIYSLHISKNHTDSIECFEMLRENCLDTTLSYDNINDDIMLSIQNYNRKFNLLFYETNNENLDEYTCSFIEIIMIILKYQENNGVAIIKISHLFYKPIIELLYLLSSLYEKAYIVKPNTSNVTTFDRYLVCKKFIVDDVRIRQNKINYYKFIVLLKRLGNKTITSIFDLEVPYQFKNKLNEINIIIGQQQLEALNQIISILKNKNKYDTLESLKKNNIQRCVNWCEKYKIPCNKFNDKINMFLTWNVSNSANGKLSEVEKEVSFNSLQEDD
jgi:hypothetical protein